MSTQAQPNRDTSRTAYELRTRTRLDDDEPPPLPPHWLEGPDAMTQPGAAPAHFASSLPAEPTPPPLPVWRSLDPEPLPVPPLHEGLGPMMSMAARMGLIVVAALAVTAAGMMFTRADMGSVFDWFRRDSATPATALVPRLAVQNQVAFTNERIRLGLTVEPMMRGASVVIVGLPGGSQITAGQPSGTLGWRLSAHEVGDVQVIPPRDFVGTVDLMADLRLADETVTDRRSVQLEWRNAAPAKASSLMQAPDAAAAAAFRAAASRSAAAPPPPANPIEESPAATLPKEQAQVPPSAVAPEDAFASAAPKATAAEIEAMVKRGEELARQGDFASARLVLRRAAEMRHAGAALALGATFDPVVLKKLGVVGTAAEPERARQWYQRAVALGSSEATRRLEVMAKDGR